MISFLIALRSVVPAGIWNRVWAAYWASFWRKQGKHEEGTLIGSERAILCEAICSSYPLRSVLEVGCAYGQNLHLVAPLMPQVSFIGVDRSSESIRLGTAELQKAGIQNAGIEEAEAEDLSRFPNKHFDLVYTCASLLYVRADKIEKVIGELVRLAKKKILLLELHEEKSSYAEQHKGVYLQREGALGGYWIRDYIKLLQQFPGVESVVAEKIPNARFKAEPWNKCGFLISVLLEDADAN